MDLENNDSFNYLVKIAKGDLNQDGFSDSVIISMDTIHKTRPFRFQIYFGLSNGKFDLFYASNELIEAMYPIKKNGEYSGNQIPDIYIKDGKLRIDFYIKGNSSYDFKYKNGFFELIHFNHVYWDGKNISETSFNLLTGKYTKRTTVLETEETILDIEKEVLLNPLPQLKDFKPFENELY